MPKLIEVDLGFATADGERVALSYQSGGLTLSFEDWTGQIRETHFDDVLAFAWGELDEEGIRDDQCYEVLESRLLARQASLQAVHPSEFAHYKLCFNACGVLDVVCRRLAR